MAEMCTLPSWSLPSGMWVRKIAILATNYIVIKLL